MPNVFSPRDPVSRPDNMDETVPHTSVVLRFQNGSYLLFLAWQLCES